MHEMIRSCKKHKDSKTDCASLPRTQGQQEKLYSITRSAMLTDAIWLYGALWETDTIRVLQMHTKCWHVNLKQSERLLGISGRIILKCIVTDWAVVRRRIDKHVPTNSHPTIKGRPLLGNRPVNLSQQWLRNNRETVFYGFRAEELSWRQLTPQKSVEGSFTCGVLTSEQSKWNNLPC
jgi:hypothetical protein